MSTLHFPGKRDFKICKLYLSVIYILNFQCLENSISIFGKYLGRYIALLYYIAIILKLYLYLMVMVQF